MQRDRSGQLPPLERPTCEGELPRPPWDPPITQDKLVGMNAEASWQGLCEVNGYYSSFDVYMQAPESWGPVRLRLLAHDMDISTELLRLNVDDIQHPQFGRAERTAGGLGVGGRIQGSIARITARPCAKFELQAFGDGIVRQGPVDSVGVEQRARVIIRASGPQSIEADQNGRAQTQPFAARHQQLNATLLLAPGVADVPFLPAPLLAEATARADRIYITGISITSHDDAVRTVSLQTRNPVSAATIPRRVYLVGGDATRSIETLETFTYPLRPDRGDIWEVSLNASNLTGHQLNITGYAE